LPFNMYCKFKRIDKGEVLATMFVAVNIIIPVLKILDVVGHDDSLFVVMSQIPRTPASLSFRHLDASGLALFEADLRNWLFQLRSLCPPFPVVSGYLGGPCWQYRVSADNPIGPFASIDALHQFLLSRVWGDERDEVLSLSRKSYVKPHRICLTHGELRRANLLLSNGRLSGLIDWGAAGWFPEYWDAVGGCYI
ncbi:hypothetical protein BKA93DRAFT_693884, partial [Sparassis latifolia]